MRFSRHLFIFVLLIALAGCATKRASSYVEVIPNPLQFWISGFGGDVTYDITRAGYIFPVSRNESLLGKPISAYRIKNDDWIRFQRIIAPLRLKDWKENYHYDMDDGWGWSLTFYSSNRVYSSTGCNSGPNPKDPSLSLQGLKGPKSSEFILADALSDLYRSSKKIGRRVAKIDSSIL